MAYPGDTPSSVDAYPATISSNSVATVVDDNGELCGELTKDQIIEILFSDKENHE